MNVLKIPKSNAFVKDRSGIILQNSPSIVMIVIFLYYLSKAQVL